MVVGKFNFILHSKVMSREILPAIFLIRGFPLVVMYHAILQIMQTFDYKKKSYLLLHNFSAKMLYIVHIMQMRFYVKLSNHPISTIPHLMSQIRDVKLHRNCRLLVNLLNGKKTFWANPVYKPQIAQL